MHKNVYICKKINFVEKQRDIHFMYHGSEAWIQNARQNQRFKMKFRMLQSVWDVGYTETDISLDFWQNLCAAKKAKIYWQRDSQKM
jgi:hypothetical protein